MTADLGELERLAVAYRDADASDEQDAAHDALRRYVLETAGLPPVILALISRLRGYEFALDTAQSQLVISNDRLRAAEGALDQLRRAAVDLIEARDMIVSWGAYASPEMQEKHDLEGDVSRISLAVIEARCAHRSALPHPVGEGT